MPEAQKKAAVKEFNFGKGILVATFSGIMSACFAYGLTAGTPINTVARHILARHHRAVFWDGLPALIVVLLGGFTTNFIWCAILHFRNRSAHEYLASTARPDENRIAAAVDGPGYSPPPEAMNTDQGAALRSAAKGPSVPLLINYVFCALAGTLWYLQFFFYTMGQTQMGPYKFSGWTLHMASIIIFATLWGVALHEWKGSCKRTHIIIAVGLAVLVGSTVIVGYGNYLKIQPKHTVPAVEKVRVAGRHAQFARIV